MTRPVERIVDGLIEYSSNNSIYLIYINRAVVNNSEITINHLHNSNKIATFAVDKGTFVLLTIKEL